MTTRVLDLPWRKHKGLPVNEPDRTEYGIEQAVRYYAEYDEEAGVDLVQILRPELTIAEITEWIDMLCNLSCLVDHAQIHESPEIFEAVRDDYSSVLRGFAIPKLCSVDLHAERAIAIVDELQPLRTKREHRS